MDHRADVDVTRRGRRVSRTRSGTTRWWLYDGIRPVAELDNSGAFVAQYVYGSKPNIPDFVIRNLRGTQVVYRVISDILGSPRYVVNVADSSEVPFRANYSAFGVIDPDTDVGLDWMPFGFAGGIYDKDTALIRFGARDYDPMVGRWTRKEPLRFRAGTNFYAYVLNDPVNLFDPTGRDPEGAGGASGAGDGGSEGAGNEATQDPPENSAWAECFDRCMERQGADVAGEIALVCLPFAPTPKTPWEYGKTLGGGSPLTTWLSRASMGSGASNALRTFGAYAAKATAAPFAAASSYWTTSAVLCSAECSK